MLTLLRIGRGRRRLRGRNRDPRCSGFWSIRNSCSASSAIRRQRRRARPIASAISSSRRACRSSCGAAFPTTSCSTLAERGQAERSRGARAAGAAHAGRSARRGAGRATSPASGCTCAICATIWPDPDFFPEFDDNLREAFRQETELFFESMLREDRSVLDLLSADYTFLNERLARHYGIPNVYGSQFRRVALHRRKPPRSARPGQHPDGDVLSPTGRRPRCAASGCSRTSWARRRRRRRPTFRLAEKKSADGKPLTDARSRWRQHRANPACASCHRVMDPLGFALENFDAIGKWRDQRRRQADRCLRRAARRHQVRRARRTCADSCWPGRTSSSRRCHREAADLCARPRRRSTTTSPSIRKIVREAAADDYRWSSLILGIVKSTPFQMRRSREP